MKEKIFSMSECACQMIIYENREKAVCDEQYVYR